MERRYTEKIKQNTEERTDKDMDEKYLETAVMLSRMYGVGETLNSWDCLKDEEFIHKIKEWTEEFLQLENGNILKFFESKVV